jgi:hypothetical protein
MLLQTNIANSLISPMMTALGNDVGIFTKKSIAAIMLVGLAL